MQLSTLQPCCHLTGHISLVLCRRTSGTARHTGCTGIPKQGFLPAPAYHGPFTWPVAPSRWTSGRAARLHLQAQASDANAASMQSQRRQARQQAEDQQITDAAEEQVRAHHEEQQKQQQEQEQPLPEGEYSSWEQMTQDQQQQTLFEGKYGLPVVRKFLKYHELLRDIRAEKIEEVAFFSQRETMDIEGICLVNYKDGTTAQSMIPHYDYRIPYSMETHGVSTVLLKPIPNMATLVPPAPPMSQKIQGALLTWLPFAALGVVYLATQLAAKLKGDLEDRKKLRAADKERLRQMEEERQVDEKLVEAEEMARMGLSVEEIVGNLERSKLPYQREDVERLVAEAQKLRARSSEPEGPAEFFNDKAADQARYNAEQKRKMEEEEEGDPMADAAAMLKMSTAKLTKATDPNEEKLRIKMRAAKRKMKGVNLQYVADRRVFFDDVAGIGEAKVELQEVVDFFTKPKLFQGSGARIPRGVLLCGPPGTGKTLLARAVAGESGVAFLSLNASEFVEMFVGVGAARVRDLFNQARALRPCIIFMDEIDAVGRTRGGAQGNDERDTTLNQMLSEMDGFGDGGETGVIVMAATNRRDVLDPALTRPGRFDRIIHIGAPDFEGRIEILNVHLKDKPTEENIDLRDIAFETQGYTGAQLANLVNTAGAFVGKAGREVITKADLLYALEWERMGPQRTAPSAERSRRIAVQEAATALVATLLPAIEPVQRVTIAPHQKLPLGHTILALNEGRELAGLFTRRYLEEQLLMVLAGRAAEEILYGVEEMSSINQRNLNLARRIVQKLVVAGALTDSVTIGAAPLAVPVDMGSSVTGQIVPRRITAKRHHEADVLMEDMLNEGYAKVKSMLQRNRAALDMTVNALLENTTMSGAEIRALVEMNGASADLEYRAAHKAAFM